jgi:hypothetical protein
MKHYLTKTAQRLLMWVIAQAANVYVAINPHPMRLQVVTEERLPKTTPELEPEPPEPDPLLHPKGRDLVYVQWLDELFENSPSAEET